MSTEVEKNNRIITINGKTYDFDSLNEESQGAFTQALEINQKIEAKKVEIRDLTYGRQYLVDFLEKKADEFTEVTPKEVSEVSEVSEKAEVEVDEVSEKVEVE